MTQLPVNRNRTSSYHLRKEGSLEGIIAKHAAYIANEVLRQSKSMIRPDEALIPSGLVDSFSLVDLDLFVDDNFGDSIEDTELNAKTFDTLQQLAKLIQERQ